MKMQYIDWKPKESTLTLVQWAERIIREYEGQGYTLTLRQLYYQFVARDLIPNTERSYKNLGNAITNARMAGMISWQAIEDRNREHHGYIFEEDIMVPIRNLPYLIEFDQWDRQDYYVEVWVEKEALGNVVSRACDRLRVPHMACKGYLSASEAWRAGQRFQEMIERGKECVLIHLGDHDPSGIDMTRDNRDRLDLFSEHEGEIDVRRIALNMDQVEEFSPPPNPAKLSDSRSGSYIEHYGYTSWELDALEPRVLERMIRNEIDRFIDQEMWTQVEGEEEEAQNLLRGLHANWDQIEPILKGGDA